MARREVFITGNIYDLGLKGLEDAVEANKGKTIELEVGRTVFQVGILSQDRAVALHWMGMTGLRNIIWQRFVWLRLRWPPVKTVSYFTDSEDLWV